MRIIGGKWRSRRLLRPQTADTRPPPDRVKETVFNVLGHHCGTLGELPELVVADIFAGSGAFGLEALSRGAKHCTFFERGKEALAALRQNVATLGAEGASSIVTADAWRAATGDSGEPFQLIFLDPPYRESLDTSPTGRVCEFLAHLPVAANGTLVVLHHPATVDWAKAAATGGWSVADARHIGTNGITIFAR